MRDKLLKSIDTLRNLYFLTLNHRGDGIEEIRRLQRYAPHVPEEKLPEVLSSLRSDIEELKKVVGCRLSDEEIDRSAAWLTSQGHGYISMPKRHIDKGFSNFAYVFPRWPHIPGHAYVQFDSDINAESSRRLFLAEERLFRDVKLLWDHITRLSSDGKTLKTREESAQQDLSSYLRLAAAAIYHFLEAYLNGIAYNCFQDNHGSMEIDDHDFLAEWDSRMRRVRYASFERKLKEYPKVCAKYINRSIDLAIDSDVEYLLGEGRLIRDALTHPSPYINFQSETPTKMQMIAGLTAEHINKLLLAAISYVRKVEEGLGHDLSRSVPWLKLNGE